MAEPFWEIRVVYRSADSKACDFKYGVSRCCPAHMRCSSSNWPGSQTCVSCRWARGRLFDHAAAVTLYEPCVQQPSATVLQVAVITVLLTLTAHKLMALRQRTCLKCALGQILGCSVHRFGSMSAHVLQVRGEERLRWPPLPLSTLEMQKRATIELRLSGERIMRLAEELYQVCAAPGLLILQKLLCQGLTAGAAGPWHRSVRLAHCVARRFPHEGF